MIRTFLWTMLASLALGVGLSAIGFPANLTAVIAVVVCFIMFSGLEQRRAIY